MNITIYSDILLEDHVHRLNVQVAPKDVVFFGFILESCEGLCHYTTIDDRNSIIQIDFPKDMYQDGLSLLEALREWNGSG